MISINFLKEISYMILFPHVLYSITTLCDHFSRKKATFYKKRTTTHYFIYDES